MPPRFPLSTAGRRPRFQAPGRRPTTAPREPSPRAPRRPWRPLFSSPADSPGHGSTGPLRWLLTYADVITLLNIFFILLYTTVKPDPERVRVVRESLARAFNVGVMQGQESRGAVLGQGGAAAPPLLFSLAQRLAETLGPFATRREPDEAVSLGLRHDAVVLRLSASLLFPSGRVDLSPAGREVLHRLAVAVRETPVELHIAGHTDAIPFSSPEYPDNWALSLARAAAVLRYLRDTEGLPDTRFSLAAYADTQPVAPNTTREGRARNRRVEILLRTPQEGR